MKSLYTYMHINFILKDQLSIYYNTYYINIYKYIYININLDIKIYMYTNICTLYN